MSGQPDFDPDLIAKLKAKFASAGEAPPPRRKRRSVASKREEREHKARTYGDGRKRPRKKPGAMVALNNTYPPEFAELVRDMADKRGIAIKDVIMQGVYLLHEQDGMGKERT